MIRSTASQQGVGLPQRRRTAITRAGSHARTTRPRTDFAGVAAAVFCARASYKFSVEKSRDFYQVYKVDEDIETCSSENCSSILVICVKYSAKLGTLSQTLALCEKVSFRI